MKLRSKTHASITCDHVAQARVRVDPARYKALCHRFPLLVRASGLAVALGYLDAKGADTRAPERLLLEQYAEIVGAASAQHLLESTRIASLAEYRRLTREVLAAAEWYKRHAEAQLKD